MLSTFILRRDMVAARRTQALIEATRDLRVAGVAASLYQARSALSRCTPDILLVDLQLADGAALPLLAEMRRERAPGARPKVLALALSETDGLAFPTIVGGADHLLIDRDGTASPVAAIHRMMSGEAGLSPHLARQVLGCLNAQDALNAPPPADERRLDWTTDASNPFKLSPGERRVVALLARGEAISSVAVRTGLSVEDIGRRIALVYRKLQWDVRSGLLMAA